MTLLGVTTLTRFAEACLPEEMSAIRDSLCAAGVEYPAAGSTVPCPHKHLHPANHSSQQALVLVDPNTYPYPFVHCPNAGCQKEIAATNTLILRHFYGFRSGTRLSQNYVEVTSAGPSLQEIVSLHPWTRNEIIADSRGRVSEEWKFHYILVLLLFLESDVLWTGTNECQTGNLTHAPRFKAVGEWAKQSKCEDTLICPNPFKTGVSSRSTANVSGRRFFIVRSDTLPQDQLCSVFRWFEATGHTLRAVVEIEGASLEGWFDYPPRHSPLLKMLQTDHFESIECDPRMAYPSTPCRLPGTVSNGSKQSLIYYKPNSNYDQ